MPFLWKHFRFKFTIFSYLKKKHLFFKLTKIFLIFVPNHWKIAPNQAFTSSYCFRLTPRCSAEDKNRSVTWQLKMLLVAALNRQTDAATVLWFEVPVPQWPTLKPAAADSKPHASCCLRSCFTLQMCNTFAKQWPLDGNDCETCTVSIEIFTVQTAQSSWRGNREL